MTRCHACGKEWAGTVKQPAVKEFCDGCGAYLHCCLNCRFYDPHAHNKCQIPTTDWVSDRAGCNFCDEFTFADAAGKNRPSGAEQGLDAFEKLFGGDGRGADEEDGSDLKRLFGD